MFEKAPAGFGYLWYLAVAFVPGAFAAHIWAYQNLTPSDRETYFAMLLAVYLGPPLIAAVIVAAARLVRTRIARRYGRGDGNSS